MSTSTSWASRPSRSTAKPETLGAWVESELERSDRMLFTVTPREELDEIGRWQALADQAWVGQVRAIVAAVNRTPAGRGEFAADEVALALNTSPTTGSRVTRDALALASLPGLLEAVSAGVLTQRHAIAVLRELEKVDLDVETRGAVVLIALARYRGQTPGELRTLIARLVLQVDLDAAQARQDKATADRFVSVYRDVDGQAVVHARGPLAQAAAINAHLDAWLAEHPRAADDDRTEQQRRYDLFVSLLTGGVEAGSWQAAIVVPFSTAAGGGLELAEVPGLGPVLPSTAHQLLEDVGSLTQVAVDEQGDVLAVSDPVKPSASPDRSSSRDDEWTRAVRLLMSRPPAERLLPQHLSTAAYTTPKRLRRYLTARDRTCVFPGCHQRITDADHRIPWPLGPTTAWNLQLLCRRHHRAKQAVFTVELTHDGHYTWTTRGGWTFTRHRQGY